MPGMMNPLTPPLGISDEGLKILQSLQHKLLRAKRELQTAESSASQATTTAQSRATICNSLTSRQSKANGQIEASKQALDRDLLQQRALEERLEASQAELVAAQAYWQHLVPRERHESLRERLNQVVQNISDAEIDAQDLRTQLAEAERSQKVRERRLREMAMEEMKRQEQEYLKAQPRKEARRVAERAVAEQKGRQSVQQLDKASKLKEQKDKLEDALREANKRAAEMDRQMEALRGRNRYLETEELKIRMQAQEQEDPLRAELLHHYRQIRVLSDLMKDPELADEEVLPIADERPAVSLTDALGFSVGEQTFMRS
eukprot:TRINITY_DN31428_c0_g1_i1.p1 TRINITY_DN31428_c0_g1~~TRINITY_DN31428_c0_g1_i1.p1  ORF type:complete len:317 (+),score=86.69 TRINITY_DN31428_c0_g1_i1:132-1082(+)